MVKVSLELCLNLMSYSREFGQLTKTEELSEEAQGALELLVQAHESGVDFVTLVELYQEFARMTSGRLAKVSLVIRTLLHQINQQIKITSDENRSYSNRVIATGHFKCYNCQHKKRYTTGQDEYPGLTIIEYCSKEHWEGGDPEPDPEPDFTVWDGCKDFCLIDNDQIKTTSDGNN